MEAAEKANPADSWSAGISGVSQLKPGVFSVLMTEPVLFIEAFDLRIATPACCRSEPSGPLAGAWRGSGSANRSKPEPSRASMGGSHGGSQCRNDRPAVCLTQFPAGSAAASRETGRSTSPSPPHHSRRFPAPGERARHDSPPAPTGPFTSSLLAAIGFQLSRLLYRPYHQGPFHLRRPTGPLPHLRRPHRPSPAPA